MREHEKAVAEYPDWMLEAVVEDIAKRGRALANYQDHEMRWLSQRAKAARAERKRRKAA